MPDKEIIKDDDFQVQIERIYNDIFNARELLDIWIKERLRNKAVATNEGEIPTQKEIMIYIEGQAVNDYIQIALQPLLRIVEHNINDKKITYTKRGWAKRKGSNR